MTEALKRYKDFTRLKKNTNQTITEFIAVFEGTYTKAKQSGCEFSDMVLAFTLLEACNLSDTDEKFILTRVDFIQGKQNKDLFAQFKSSMKIFQGRESTSSDDKLTVDETLVSNIKEALVAEGWAPPDKEGKYRQDKKKGYKGRKNPLGRDGKPMKCFGCQSEYHMLGACDKNRTKEPEKERKNPTMLSVLLRERKNEARSTAGKKEEVMVMCVNECVEATAGKREEVMVTNDEEELCLLLEDAGVRGVIDTACSKTVAGITWVEKYTSNLPEEMRESLELEESSKVYQFGGGEKRSSLGSVKVPTVVGDKKISLSVEVVDAMIPLLIGTNSLEAAASVLNFEHFTATFFEQEVEMYKVGSGHYCIDLTSDHVDTHINDIEDRETEILEVLTTTTELDFNLKDIKKLHHYFGHVPAGRLKSLLIKAGHDSKEVMKIVEEVAETCDSCIKTQRKVPRPKTAIPRVSRPNEIVTVDLKEFSKSNKNHRYICYLIDMHSRLAVADYISEKTPENVIDVIMRRWIPVFGVMEGLHSDIGGEMSNDKMEDVASYLNVKLTTTAANSPHQNGINERNHATVDLMITRMLDSDSSLTPDRALLWALNAKNSLENCHGFSPFQLHIGYNPILPSTTREGPPAMENVTKSKSFASHINTIHEAREAFIQAESSSTLKKALKSRIYPRGEDIQNGDWIYYKKENGHGEKRIWRGPSKVTSTNGKKLFVDQGSRLGTVNRDNAVKVGEEFWKMDQVQENEEVDNDDQESEDERDSSEDIEEEIIDSIQEKRKETKSQENENKQEIRDNETEHGEEEVMHRRYTHRDIKKDDIIKYKLPNSHEWETSRVISRAGKSTGKNKYWWNVETIETGEKKSLDTENISEIEQTQEENIQTEEALVVVIPRYMHDQAECVEAKEKELENWDNFATYKEVEDQGQEILDTNWHLVSKEGGVKARLCIRGDREKGKESIRTDSPTVQRTNVKLFYLIAAKNNWKIRTADVKAAFLQGAPLEREVFVKPLKERRIPGILWQMLKGAYGLVDASRGFFLEVAKTAVELGCVQSIHDPCMYMYYLQDGTLDGMVMTHVDDMLHGSGGSEFEKNVMQPLRERFKFGKEEEDEFDYIGLHVSKKGDAIAVNQDKYLATLEVPDISELRHLQGEDILSEEFLKIFRETIGKIGWMTSTSRPDLVYEKVILNTKVGKASVNDLKAATKIIRKLKNGPTDMTFPNLGDVSEWTLQGYGDAGFKSIPDKVSSCGGQVVMIVNKTKGKRCVVSWRSRKLRRVVSSSTAAEALAANDTLDELVYLKEVLKEVVGTEANKIPIELFTDSRNLHRSVTSTSLVDNPRMRADVAKLKQSLENRELNYFWKVAGEQMLADCLTKKGASAEKLLKILQHASC